VPIDVWTSVTVVMGHVWATGGGAYPCFRSVGPSKSGPRVVDARLFGGSDVVLQDLSDKLGLA